MSDQQPQPQQAPAAPQVPQQAPAAPQVPQQAPAAPQVPQQAPAAPQVPQQAPTAPAAPQMDVAGIVTAVVAGMVPVITQIAAATQSQQPQATPATPEPLTGPAPDVASGHPVQQGQQAALGTQPGAGASASPAPIAVPGQPQIMLQPAAQPGQPPAQPPDPTALAPHEFLDQFDQLIAHANAVGNP